MYLHSKEHLDGQSYLQELLFLKLRDPNENNHPPRDPLDWLEPTLSSSELAKEHDVTNQLKGAANTANQPGTWI